MQNYKDQNSGNNKIYYIMLVAGWILSGLTAAAKIQPIEFQNQRAAPIRTLNF